MTVDSNIKHLSLNFSHIAHYRIVNQIGQGGMSIVYEAVDERLKRKVAIKILHPFLADRKEYRQRFFREAQAVARLSHPNIVQIFDVAETDNKLYIVTELLQGETLKDYANKIEFIKFPELASMLIWQIALALEHAHRRGIIHRDLKPENIMIQRNGQVKLMDFGIASIGSDESITQDNSLMGSLAHLAPEIIQGKKADERSDIFSLTTIYYWLLGGRLPFEGDSPHALLNSIVKDKPSKIQMLSSHITDDLSLIVDKGMSKEPKHRFSSASDMANKIEETLLSMGIAIDLKELQGVLREPNKRKDHFNKHIEEQIKNKIKIHQREGNDLQVIALSCRINTQHKKNPIINSSKYRFMLAPIFLCFILLAGYYFFATKPVIEKNDDTALIGMSLLPFNTLVKEEMSYLPDDFVIENKEVVIEKKIRPPKNLVSKKAKLNDVEIVVWPFADILIDGKLVAHDKKSFNTKLLAGYHRFTFIHDYAATVEKVLLIKDQKKSYKINIQMSKTKPALLVIKANIDADIAVDGIFKGSSDDTLKRPIVIPMPDKTYSTKKEVILSKDGFEPYIIEIELIAGTTKEIFVELRYTKSI